MTMDSAKRLEALERVAEAAREPSGREGLPALSVWNEFMPDDPAACSEHMDALDDALAALGPKGLPGFAKYEQDDVRHAHTDDPRRQPPL